MVVLELSNIVMLSVLVCFIFICVNILCTKKSFKYTKPISFRAALDLAELPVITFLHNGIKLNFILDTGANLSVLDRTKSKELELEYTQETANVVGIASKTENVSIATIKIEYNRSTYSEDFQLVDMQDTFNEIKKATGVTLHGLLGNSFLSRYQGIIDFDKCVFYLSKNNGKRNKVRQ